MRFVLDFHLELGPPPDPEPEQRDSALDAMVERRDEDEHRTSTIGFGRATE